MRIELDLGKCMGYGNCIDPAPEVFDIDEDTDQAVLLMENPGPEYAEQVRRAARVCPAKAIILHEEDAA